MKVKSVVSHSKVSINTMFVKSSIYFLDLTVQ